MPKGIPVVDLMMGIPVSETNTEWYESFKPLLMDEESRQQFKMPAQYMFKDIPVLPGTDDYVQFLVSQMDRYGIDVAMVGYFEGSQAAMSAKRQYPDRFISGFVVQPRHMDLALKEIERCVEKLKLKLLCLPTHFLNADEQWTAIADESVYPIFELADKYGLAVQIHPYDGEEIIKLQDRFWLRSGSDLIRDLDLTELLDQGRPDEGHIQRLAPAIRGQYPFHRLFLNHVRLHLPESTERRVARLVCLENRAASLERRHAIATIRHHHAAL
jgi:hypothetical protein